MGKKASKETKSKIVSAAWKLLYEQGSDNTTDQRTAAGQSVHKVGILEVGGAEEESLQAFLGTTYDGSIVAE